MKCDELKAIESATAVIENVHLVYRKSEVDSAIDELKREHHRERHEYIKMVAQLKADLEAKELEFFILKEDALNTDKARENWLQLARKQDKEIRHHKYKRCLAMARIAQDDWHLHNSFYAMGHQEFEKRKCEFYEKWRKRWLSLADKFKKET